MSELDHDLIEAAASLIAMRSDDCYHTTAATARARDGRIVSAVNVYHFTGGPCAELVVIGRAVADGAADLEQIVAVGDRDRGILPPCGRCRQILFDLYPTIGVSVDDGAGPALTPIAELLPLGARWDANVGSIPPGLTST